MKFSVRDFRVRSMMFSIVCVVILFITYTGAQVSSYWLIASLVLAAFALIVVPSLRIASSLNQIESEHTLLEEEQKFRWRVENSIDAIFETDEHGCYIYVSPSAEVLTGYTSNELIGMKFNEMIDPEHRAESELFFRNQVINKVENTYFQFPIVHKSGKRIWVGQSTRLIFNGDKFKKAYGIARDITEIREAKESLEKSEARFKQLAENSLVGIHEMNAEAKVIYFNRQWNEISGLNATDTSEERLKAVHEDDRERVIREWGEAVKKRKDVSLEFRFRHPIRGIVWVLSRTSPMFDDDGELQGFIGTLTDITDVKETYLKLLKSEETYRLISTNASDVITLFKNDKESTRLFVSPSSKNIFGYEPEELVGTSGFNLMIPEDAERMRQRVQPATLSGKSMTSQFRIKRKDGAIIWLESISNPFFDGEGKVTGFQASMRDITRRKEIELKLEERERLYRLLSENTLDLIAINDTGGNYTFVSSSFKTVLGYELNELLGTSGYLLVHPDDQTRLHDGTHQKTLEGISTSGVEFRMKKKDGSYIWVETFVRPIFDEHNNVTSIQTSSRDISRKKADELALQQAKTKAEEANKAKSQFLSMMSHEIRTPMNAVIGLTNFMLEDNPAPNHLQNLNLLKYSGENLLSIINDILDFSKIEAGKIDLEEISFNLTEFLENIIHVMQSKAKAKDIALVLNIQSTLPKGVRGDPVRINQVLSNLLSNSLKFTEHGSVELAVTSRRADTSHFEVTFCVSDTGIGIASEKLDLIFENFSQANRTITRKFGGTGLGLSISKRLVNLMGGELRVSSVIDKGSRFFFTLVMKEAATITDHKLNFTEQQSQSRTGYNILVAEDNRVNQVVVNNFLRKWGFNVTIVDDGSEAVKAIESQTFHLVLMDLQMPNMDGYEATKTIRAMNDDYFRKVPIIALTASAIIEHLEDIHAAGMNAMLTKPFKAEELLQKINEYLDKPVTIKKETPTSEIISKLFAGQSEEEKKLNSLIINNLHELINAVNISTSDMHTDVFRKIAHKSKTALAILNDSELTALVQHLNSALSQNRALTAEELDEKNRLVSMCERKIRELEE